MRIIFDAPRIADYVSNKIEPGTEFVDFTAIGLEHHGAVVCGVIYDNYTKDDIRMHVAASHVCWCRPQYLRVFFDYPFNQLGCRRVTGIVHEDNLLARQVDEKLGFVQEGRIRQAFANKDGILYGMLRDECKWL